MARGRKTGGRKKGSLNVVTRSVKQALARAFDDLGGVPSLGAWGRENPGDFYRLWGRLVPLDVTSGEAKLAPTGVIILPAVED